MGKSSNKSLKREWEGIDTVFALQLITTQLQE